MVPGSAAFLSDNWQGERMEVVLSREESFALQERPLESLAFFPLPTSLTQFPVAAERDHVTMLASVTHCKSEMPASITQELSLLLHEVGCILLSFLTPKLVIVAFSLK